MRHASGSDARGAPSLLALALLLVRPAAVAADVNPELTPWLVLPDTTLSLSLNGASLGPPLFVESADFGAAPDGGPLRVYAPPPASDPYGLGCDPLPALPAEASARGAYALTRGVCPFAAKAANAAAAGAAAVLIMDTPAGAYINTANTSALNATNAVAGSCYFDCGAGAGAVSGAEAGNVTAAVGGYPGRCSSSGTGCDSGLCLLTGAPAPGGGSGGQRQVCCAVTNYLPMQAPGTQAAALASIQAVFLPAGASAALQAALAAAGPLASSGGAVDPLVATLTLRPLPAFDPAGILMVLLGTAVAALASFYAGWPEREAIRCILRGEAPPVLSAYDANDPASSGGVELGVRAACVMLLAAVVLLGGLFALIQLGVQIVFIVYALFFFGASSSVATVLVRPVIVRYAPGWEKVTLVNLPRWGLVYTSSRLASLAVGWTAAGLFLAYRHAGWSWALQDALGICLCCLFLASVRISSLRTAMLALSAFFVYGACGADGASCDGRPPLWEPAATAACRSLHAVLPRSYPIFFYRRVFAPMHARCRHLHGVHHAVDPGLQRDGGRRDVGCVRWRVVARFCSGRRGTSWRLVQVAPTPRPPPPPPSLPIPLRRRHGCVPLRRPGLLLPRQPRRRHVLPPHGVHAHPAAATAPGRLPRRVRHAGARCVPRRQRGRRSLRQPAFASVRGVKAGAAYGYTTASPD
jgi:hypothetical protein